MTTAHQLAQEQGFALRNDIITNPGRFEGEHVSILYWEEAMMNGDCTHEEEFAEFTITPDDLAACPGIPADAKHARLTHHDSGFVTLSYHP
jgi:hypothetical protein